MYWRKLLLFFFPQVCVACDEYADYFCADCQDHIDFLYYRPRFAVLDGLVDQLYVLGFFAPPLSKIIKALKYQSLWPIGAILGDLLYKHLPLPRRVDCVTAVPLHPKRQAWRGYNQAELIARQVAKRLGVSYQPLLLRTHHTQNLASTKSVEERSALSDHAFSLNPDYMNQLSGKNILLIDDVVTTGATLAACAAALKTANTHKIFAAAVAHEG